MSHSGQKATPAKLAAPESSKRVHEGCSKETVEESIVLSLLKLSESLKKKSDKVCKRHGITSQQWLLMLHLAGDPNIPAWEEQEEHSQLLASDLARSLNVSRPNVTILINVLMKKGFMIQTEKESDRRKKYLSLTKEGMLTLALIEPYRKIASKSILGDLKESEKVWLLNWLECSFLV